MSKHPTNYAILSVSRRPFGEGSTSRKLLCRHLSFLLCRFFRSSRVETPRGSLPGFPSGDLPTRIPSITDRHSLAPRSFTRIAIGNSHEQPTTREPYGLTTKFSEGKENLDCTNQTPSAIDPK